MTATTLGARIAQARRELGVRTHRDVSPSDVAEALGVSPATVYRWESDEKSPREEALAKLAKFLKVTPAYLRYGVVESETPTLDRLQKDKEHTVSDVLRAMQKPVAKRKNGGKAS